MVRFTGNWVSGDLNRGYPDKLGIPNPVSNVFPDISINGAISTGFGHQLDAVLAETTFAPSDVLTLVRGKHILKMGGEWETSIRSTSTSAANPMATSTLPGSPRGIRPTAPALEWATPTSCSAT
jgi:hypothetical protein